ncbi:MAG: HEAT repeat domain-containing protein [Deltaproteobacteria bacterium]
MFISLLLLFPTSAFLQTEKGVEELIRDLQDEKPLIRWQAAEQLGRAKDARAVEPLIEALGDGDEGVRREVTKALGEIGSPRAVGPLGRMLEDPDESVRLNTLAALEKIRSDEAITLIISALKNDDSMVRMIAAASLGRIGDSRAAGPLKEAAATDTLSYVRSAARRSLAQISGETTEKTSGEPKTKPLSTDAAQTPLLSELEAAAQRIHDEYGLVLDYQRYDIIDLLDIEARMKMRSSHDTIESVLGDLLTPEDKERNRHLFEQKE